MASFGEAVPGVPLVLRADQAGLAVVVASLVAALFALGAADRRPGEEAALLVTAAGAALAALAGNAVILFAGAEIASLGGLLLATAGRGRVSRGAVTAFTIQHVFALGLLVAAVAAHRGHRDQQSLRGSPGRGRASRWRSPGALPARGACSPRGGGRGPPEGGRPGAGSPSGRSPAPPPSCCASDAATGGAGAPGFTVPLAVAGAAAALWGAVAAWRWRHEFATRGPGAAHRLGRHPGRRRRRFPAAPEGSPPGWWPSSWPCWRRPPGACRPGPAAAAARSPPSRWRRRRAAASASGPRAAVLELGAVAALGRPYAPLLIALGAAAVIAAGGGLVGRPARPSARRRRPSPPRRRCRALPRHPREHARAGSGSTCVPRPMPSSPSWWGRPRRCCPGVVGAAAARPPGGQRRPRRHRRRHPPRPGGPWPGGYLSVALLVVLLGGRLRRPGPGRHVPHPAHGDQGPRPRAAWVALVGPRRALGPIARRLGRGAGPARRLAGAQPGPGLHRGRGPRRPGHLPLPVNQPLLDLIAFAAGAVAVMVDRRRAVLAACDRGRPRAGSGGGPLRRRLGGGGRPRGAVSWRRWRRPLAGVVAARRGSRAPRARSAPLGGPRTRGFSGPAASASRPASSPWWRPRGSASTCPSGSIAAVQGALFPVAFIFTCGVLRPLPRPQPHRPRRRRGRHSPWRSVSGWLLRGGSDPLPEPRGSIAIAPVAVAMEGWLAARRRRDAPVPAPMNAAWLAAAWAVVGVGRRPRSPPPSPRHRPDRARAPRRAHPSHRPGRTAPRPARGRSVRPSPARPAASSPRRAPPSGSACSSPSALDGRELLGIGTVGGAVVLLLSTGSPLLFGVAALLAVAALTLRWVTAAPSRATLAAGRIAGTGAAALVAASLLLPAPSPRIPAGGGRRAPGGRGHRPRRGGRRSADGLRGALADLRRSGDRNLAAAARARRPAQRLRDPRPPFPCSPASPSSTPSSPAG